MSTATPIQRKRDNPGEPERNGGPTSFGSRKRLDSDFGELAAVTVTPPVETVYNRWYATPKLKADALHAEVRRMKAELGTGHGWASMLHTKAKFPTYSLENILILSDQAGGELTRVAKYAKWQLLGRQVTKGVKGYAILDSKRVRVQLMDNVGRPLLDEMGLPRRGNALTSEPTTSTVFDVSQTSGPELPAEQRKLSSAPPARLIEDLTRAVENLGFEIVYEKMTEKGLFGYTDNDRRVVLREGASATSHARALAHELGHITAGHVDRFDYTGGHGGHGGRAEAEAHSIAYTLLIANGMKADPASEPAAIIGAWDRPDQATVVAAAQNIHQAVRGLFHETKWANAAV